MATKGEATKDNILEIAETIILQKGFSGTSIDEIIAASNITKGGFFYHFDSKNDLAKHLMLKYQRDDNAFFSSLFERAYELSEDPLQQMLIFLKLLAEAFANLPAVHPGCLIATFTLASQQLNEDVKRLTTETTLCWRDVFSRQLEKANEKYPMKIDVPVDDLADMLSSVIEGGIILSRSLNEQRILPDHILQYRNYLRLLFGNS